MQVKTATDLGALHQEMSQLRADLRREMGQFRSEMRVQFRGLRSDLRVEFADARVDFIKWSFVFWIGQLVALSSVMALMLRAAGR